MNKKLLQYAMLLLALIFFYTPPSYSADPTFNFYLANATWDSHKVYEFDILIQSTDVGPIELDLLSLGFTIPNGSLNSGTLTATWVPGSSELTNSAQISSIFNTAAISGTGSSALRVIKNANGPPVEPGMGSMLSNVSPGTRIGRMRLTNTVDFVIFGSNYIDIAARTEYPTDILAHINGATVIITSGATFIKNLSGPLFQGSGSSIKLLYPNGGESWNVGSIDTIKWEPANVTNAKIEYSTDNGSSWSTIIASTPASSGSYAWTVPNNLSTQCKVRISDTSDPSKYSINSNVFTIWAGSTISITSPNGGENWKIGQIDTVKWTSVNVSNAKIEYSTDNGTNWATVVESTPAPSGNYAWTVPNVLSSKCKLRISNVDNASVFTVSANVFTIWVASTISLSSPKGGEYWKVGDVDTIKWNSTNLTNAKIEYSTDNGTDWNIVIASTPASIGSYNWTIPYTASSVCRVRITDLADSSNYNMSLDVFTIYTGNPTFNFNMINDSWDSHMVYEVDLVMQSTDAAPIELANFGMGLTINDNALNGGTVTASWVPGSSQLTNTNQIPYSFNTLTISGTGSNALRVIKIVGTAPSGAGNGSMISNVPPGTRIGRLRLTNTADWIITPPNVIDTAAQTIYPKNINAYIAGVNVNITSNLSMKKLYSPLFSSNITLPVELSSFASTTQGRNIILKWSTVTEKNSDRFEVERSLVSDANWSTIASFKAAAMSLSPKYYSYSDSKLQPGKYQYRLKMIDYNGSFSYSSIQSAEIAIPKNFTLNQNYPNPFNPSTKIDYQLPVNAKVIMEIYNIEGQKIFELVNQDQSSGYYSVDFNSSLLNKNIASGVYLYRIIATNKADGSNFTAIKKMVILK
ncbi:MAG: T9SS type A sorting domain-containing protein [Ignavibacteriaceae bacterium]|nr:T9SS type A sorting domain-containing protein [Ignavibacteriaceae bacterium]